MTGFLSILAFSFILSGGLAQITPSPAKIREARILVDQLNTVVDRIQLNSNTSWGEIFIHSDAGSLTNCFSDRTTSSLFLKFPSDWYNSQELGYELRDKAKNCTPSSTPVHTSPIPHLNVYVVAMNLGILLEQITDVVNFVQHYTPTTIENALSRILVTNLKNQISSIEIAYNAMTATTKIQTTTQSPITNNAGPIFLTPEMLQSNENYALYLIMKERLFNITTEIETILKIFTQWEKILINEQEQQTLYDDLDKIRLRIEAAKNPTAATYGASLATISVGAIAMILGILRIIMMVIKHLTLAEAVRNKDIALMKREQAAASTGIKEMIADGRQVLRGISTPVCHVYLGDMNNYDYYMSSGYKTNINIFVLYSVTKVETMKCKPVPVLDKSGHFFQSKGFEIFNMGSIECHEKSDLDFCIDKIKNGSASMESLSVAQLAEIMPKFGQATGAASTTFRRRMNIAKLIGCIHSLLPEAVGNPRAILNINSGGMAITKQRGLLTLSTSQDIRLEAIFFSNNKRIIRTIRDDSNVGKHLDVVMGYLSQCSSTGEAMTSEDRTDCAELLDLYCDLASRYVHLTLPEYLQDALDLDLREQTRSVKDSSLTSVDDIALELKSRF